LQQKALMGAIANGSQARGGTMMLIIHFRRILNQQHPRHLATLLACSFHMRLHQGFIAHMRILAEAIDRLASRLTLLLGWDGTRWFSGHRRRDHYRPSSAGDMSQLHPAKGLLCPLLRRY
jgi:hypothetical protein